MHESLKVSGMILIANDQAAKVKQPRKEALHFPASFVAAQGPSVLGARVPVGSVGRDHFDPKLLHQLLIQSVAVVGFVPDQSFRYLGHHAFFQRGFHQLHFSRRSAFCPQGERKTMTVCNTHDLGALAALGFPNQEPPFLAGTKVPSTKHSLRSNPPASWRCWASVNKSFSMTPERTQCWKRRWAVWYGPYRGGRSFHGAPVRRIHKTPSSTLRRSLHGRPRPSSRTRSGGRMGSTIFHCWSVKSIHNYYTVPEKVQETFCHTLYAVKHKCVIPSHFAYL
jgi:hypothetical protein